MRVKRMYIVSPVYVQRTYAANDGIYKVHAAAKSSQSNRTSGDRPLFDLLTALSQNPTVLPKPDVSGDEPKRRRALREPLTAPAAVLNEDPQTAADVRERNGGFIPNPLDRTAQGRPFSPYGRFRELGFDAASGYLPPKPLDHDQQMPRQLRHAAMVRAYSR